MPLSLRLDSNGLVIRITVRGIQYVEGDLEQQAAPSVTINVGGNAYGNIFGAQQHAEMNVSFDFSTVEAELDRAEEEVERRGGRVRQNSRS